MMLPIVACLVGIYFGLADRITILIPVAVIGALICSCAAFASGQSASAMLIPMVSLQGGYMLGLTSRDFLGQFFAALANFSRKEFR
jgi:predicted neutral ceramidase superfamily lipid hydrolase